MTNTQRFAKQELDILAATVPGSIITPFTNEILALCETFGKSGQSGGSAPMTATAISQAIKKLCLQEPICPITGIEQEWVDVSLMGGGKIPTIVYQNSRCGSLFREGQHGNSHFLDAIIWKEENGNTYYGDAIDKEGKRYHSKQYIKSFPFTPKTFYIDVVKEILPNDWTEEPFIEWDYYLESEFKETGVKRWIKEKYRNIIKDTKQLNRVWKYYNEKKLS